VERHKRRAGRQAGAACEGDLAVGLGAVEVDAVLPQDVVDLTARAEKKAARDRVLVDEESKWQIGRAGDVARRKVGARLGLCKAGKGVTE
jgi:hypothetical protein